MENKDPLGLYKALHVSTSASPDEIRKSYKKLALKWHPDKNQGNEEATLMFQKISQAYAVLSDEEKKAHYDRTGSNGEDGDDMAGAEDFMDLFASMFGGDGDDFMSMMMGAMFFDGMRPGEEDSEWSDEDDDEDDEDDDLDFDPRKMPAGFSKVFGNGVFNMQNVRISSLDSDDEEDDDDLDDESSSDAAEYGRGKSAASDFHDLLRQMEREFGGKPNGGKPAVKKPVKTSVSQKPTSAYEHDDDEDDWEDDEDEEDDDDEFNGALEEELLKGRNSSLLKNLISSQSELNDLEMLLGGRVPTMMSGKKGQAGAGRAAQREEDAMFEQFAKMMLKGGF